METQEISFIRSPRREIQGPRPTPLKLRKDSHKIRKPPTVPGQAASHHPHYQHAPPRPPVIIYTVSPKIIHANPNEFMSLVQRLTGPNSACTTVSNSPSTASSSSFAFKESGGAVSPAARLASIENIKSPDGRKAPVLCYHDAAIIDGIEIGSDIQRTAQFPAGILSPNPNALPPIPPNFFSPPSDLGFNFPEFISPVLYGNSLTMPSPSTLFSPQINMPSPNTLHLFNTLFDL